MTMLVAATDRGAVLLEDEEGRWIEKGRALKDMELTAVSAQRQVVLAGSRDGIYRSEDGGRRWGRPDDGIAIPHVRWLFQHPDRPELALAGTEPAAIFVSHDAGRTWVERPEVGNLRDRNGWSLPYSPEAGCVRGFDAHGDRIYAAVEQGGMLRSDDGGTHWRIVDGSTGKPDGEPAPGFIQNDVHSLQVHPSSPELVFAATGGGLYRTADGGSRWTRLYRCYCRTVCADPENPDYIVFGPADGVSENGRVEMSHDGGETWQDASDGLDAPWPAHMVERFVLWNGTIFAVLSDGKAMVADMHRLKWRGLTADASNVNALAVAP